MRVLEYKDGEARIYLSPEDWDSPTFGYEEPFISLLQDYGVPPNTEVTLRYAFDCPEHCGEIAYIHGASAKVTLPRVT